MTIEAAVVAVLQAANVAGDRIYHAPLLAGATLPAITYQRISAPRLRNLNTGPAGMTESRIQFDLWGASYGDVKALQKELRGLLDGYAGTVSGFKIYRARVDSERDDFEEARLYWRVISDYIFAHQTAG